MPDLVMGSDGEAEALRLFVKASVAPPRIWHLRIFKNDYVPNRDIVLDDLVEATFAGYDPVPLDPANWTTPVDLNGVAVSYYGLGFINFLTTSGTQVVFGYYVTFDDGEKLLYAERFISSVTVSTTVPAPVWPVMASRSASEPAPPPPP